MTDYDVIIIGAGPAGLAAGIYAGRRNLKTLIIGELIGGQMSLAHIIENYPGFEGITGLDLTKKMQKQAEKFGCEIKIDKVIDMELKGDIKKIKTSSKEYTCKAVIIASGGQHRKLNVEGEDKYIGKGVSYCATCNGPLFRDKIVAVVGGSDTALMYAVYLDEICKKVYLIHRRDQFRAEEANQENLKKSKVKLILNSIVEKIEGNESVKNLKIKNVKNGEVSDLAVEGVFIEVGHIPSTYIANKAGVEIDEKKFIIVNKDKETNVKGVFAAGDVTGTLAQIATAVGDGAIAATNAYYYIHGPAYSKKIIDWGEKRVK